MKLHPWPQHEADLRHFFEFGEPGPRSTNLDPDSLTNVNREPVPPRYPPGANFWTIRTVELRLREADRRMPRVDPLPTRLDRHTSTRPVGERVQKCRPCCSEVLRTYYRYGEHWAGSVEGGMHAGQALLALYPLVAICPVGRHGETQTEALARLGDAVRAAQGPHRVAWRKVREAALSLLQEARRAYDEAAREVEAVRGPTPRERLDQQWARAFGH
jgi:hypothetical protein